MDIYQNPLFVDDLLEVFELMEDWEERYKFIIELGGKLEPLPEDLRKSEHLVKGCMSKVWFVPFFAEKDGQKTFHFHADSDAFIVKGLVALLVGIYDGLSPEDMAKVDIEATFTKLGLSEHLSPIRRNGFFSMVEKIQQFD